MSFYKRNLPHWQPEGAEYFVTFRLAGSLPKKAIADLKDQRKEMIRKANRKEQESSSRNSLSVLRAKIHRHIFKKYEQLLDNSEIGPTWLRQLEVAEIVKEAIHYRDQEVYDLYAYCLMSNHVHMVFRIIEKTGQESVDYPLTNLMQKLKSITAVRSNRILGRSGTFWQQESYDHVIRDPDERERIIKYTLNNPVKAGVVRYWEQWPHNYCKPDFLSSFRTKP